MQAVAEFGENPYSDPRGQYSLSTGPGEVPSYRPKLFPAHGKEDHATLHPPPVFPARVTSSVPSQAPLEWPLPPRLAEFARAASAEVMDTGGDFDVASLIFGWPSTKKKGKQAITGQMRMSSLLPSPATLRASTTPLSYAMASPMTPAPASSPAPSTFSYPCPRPRLPADHVAKQLSEFILTLQSPGYNALSSPRFAELAELSLAFVWQVLQDPALKDHPLPQSVCGPTSFEAGLAQIIAMSGPLPPTPAAPTTILPPVEKAARRLAPEHEAAVPPPPSKKPRPAAPAPLPRSAAPKRAPAKAVAAPCCSKSAVQPVPASVPLGTVAGAPAPPPRPGGA
jgi:hypothetical protein